MPPNENSNDSDALDALAKWDQHVSHALTRPIEAAQIIQTAKTRQRKRTIAAGSFAIGVVCLLGITVAASLNHSKVDQMQSAKNDSDQPQPLNHSKDSTASGDSQIASARREVEVKNSSDSFDQQLAMVDSSLAGFWQLNNTINQLNAVERRSQQNQYQIERNQAMLEVLSSSLPHTN